MSIEAIGIKCKIFKSQIKKLSRKEDRLEFLIEKLKSNSKTIEIDNNSQKDLKFILEHSLNSSGLNTVLKELLYAYYQMSSSEQHSDKDIIISQSADLRSLIENQINAFTCSLEGKSKTVRYSNSAILLALNIYSKSPSAYVDIKDRLCLPSERHLQRYKAGLGIHSGVLIYLV